MNFFVDVDDKKKFERELVRAIRHYLQIVDDLSGDLSEACLAHARGGMVIGGRGIIDVCTLADENGLAIGVSCKTLKLKNLQGIPSVNFISGRMGEISQRTRDYTPAEIGKMCLEEINDRIRADRERLHPKKKTKKGPIGKSGTKIYKELLLFVLIRHIEELTFLWWFEPLTEVSTTECTWKINEEGNYEGRNADGFCMYRYTPRGSHFQICKKIPEHAVALRLEGELKKLKVEDMEVGNYTILSAQ